uniref:Uncharacterized protein n=1 Tax=Vespula pensylvanica TaxID=30213 RepID=A0A834P367_VESPE|nr:hypothetical protein H0235_008052 [Vespula pensylvanica]
MFMIILTNNRYLIGGIAFNEISLTLVFANSKATLRYPYRGKTYPEDNSLGYNAIVNPIIFEDAICPSLSYATRWIARGPREVDRVESYDIRIVRFAAAEFPALPIEASEIPRISRGWLHRVGVDRILLSMLVILFECQEGFCQFSIERKKKKDTNGSLATTRCASQCLMAYGNAWSLAVKFCRVSVISRGYTQENDPLRYEALEKSCFGIMGYSINENTRSGSACSRSVAAEVPRDGGKGRKSRANGSSICDIQDVLEEQWREVVHGCRLNLSPSALREMSLDVFLMCFAFLSLHASVRPTVGVLGC